MKRVLGVTLTVLAIITWVFAEGGFSGEVKRTPTMENVARATVHWWGTETDSCYTNASGHYYVLGLDNGLYGIGAHKRINDTLFVALDQSKTINNNVVVVDHLIMYPNPNK
jgi:hypothetical protein